VTASRTRLAAILVAGLLGLTSCGGTGPTSEATTQTQSNDAPATAPPDVVVKANRNCGQMLRDVKRVGRQVRRTNYNSVAELTTEGLAEPGLALIKELARRQQRLRDAASSASFDLYASSFDPIIVLAEQWLQAQRKGDSAEAERLQELLTDLGAEQGQLALRAHLSRCGVDFLNAMVRSATL
jgi:hypothetical protein